MLISKLSILILSQYKRFNWRRNSSKCMVNWTEGSIDLHSKKYNNPLIYSSCSYQESRRYIKMKNKLFSEEFEND